MRENENRLFHTAKLLSVLLFAKRSPENSRKVNGCVLPR